MSFPDGFLWGAATSAYQIEGATREDGRGPSIWDVFAAEPGRVAGGDTGEIAVDHYHRMREDVALMAELGLTSYRFSIGWPRVLPSGRGATNPAGLDFYSRLVDTLLAKGITPVATLYHWDLPLPLYEAGGWRNRATAEAFAEYAEVMARALGDRVGWWVTQNEPWCTAHLGYVTGEHAPGLRGERQAAVDVAHHLLLGHGLAMARIREQAPGALVGAALNLFPIFAGDERPETARAVARADRFHNRWFLDPLFRGEYPTELFSDMGTQPPPVQAGDMAIISAPADFLGINYYSRWMVRADGSPQGMAYVHEAADGALTEMGWEVYPHGLDIMLEELTRDYRPAALLVTENGAAFADEWNGDGRVADRRRVRYLRDHLAAVERAIEHGAPVTGYFAWSLMDNFEWAQGYDKRFGLIYVDFATQRRIIKDSGRWYAGFIAGQRAQ